MKLRKNKKQFEEAEDNSEKDLFRYLEGYFDPEDEEDISLESYDKYGEEEDNWGRRWTERARVPPQSWQHLQARAKQKEEYSLESSQIIVMTMLHMNTSLAGMENLKACSVL